MHVLLSATCEPWQWYALACVVLGLWVWILEFWLFLTKDPNMKCILYFNKHRCMKDTKVFAVGYEYQHGRQSNVQKYHGLRRHANLNLELCLSLSLESWQVTKDFLIFCFLTCKKEIVIHTSCDSCVKWYDMGENTKLRLHNKQMFSTYKRIKSFCILRNEQV